MKPCPHIPPMIVGDRHAAELVVPVDGAGAADCLRVPLTLSQLTMLAAQAAALVQSQVAYAPRPVTDAESVGSAKTFTALRPDHIPVFAVGDEERAANMRPVQTLRPHGLGDLA